MSRLETTIVDYPYEMSHPFVQFPIYDLLMRYGWGFGHDSGTLYLGAYMDHHQTARET